MLPRTSDGRLPFHQLGAALEASGMLYEQASLKRLSSRPEHYPAVIRTETDGALALIEIADDEVLVWRPDSSEARWEKRRELNEEFTGDFTSVMGDPSRVREGQDLVRSTSRGHWFWSELRRARAGFKTPLVASFLINLLALALPLFTMNVYDRILPNEAEASLWVLALGVLLAFSLEFALRTARTNVVDEVGRRLDLRLSEKIFARILSIPLSARKGSTGALAAKVNEYALVRDFFASTTVMLMVDLCFMVLFVAVIAYIAGWLALVPIVAMILMAIAGYVLQREVVEAARDAQSDHGLQQTMLVEAMAGMETLKSVSGERSMLGRWGGLAEMSASSQARLKKINSTAVSLASTFQQICSVSLIVGGYYLFVSGEISMGAIIAIVMLASRSLAPAGQIAFLITRGRQAREALSSIEAIFDEDDERRHGSMSFPVQKSGREITLDRVSFTYPEGSVAALNQVSLRFEPGERVAIIGRVASGKSTLGRVLCGLYQPTEGAVRVDGTDARQYRPQVLRRALRFVGQDADLFTGSIRDNLAIGNPGTSDEAIMEALAASGADQFLSRDAVGFERQVGEHGRMLSGGQRAFLALSRAFASPFELLFLDEPTGAMDSRTEAIFVERLKATLLQNQTLVVSTHRPALFALCSRIVVMDQGQVVADGSKEEILSARQGEVK